MGQTQAALADIPVSSSLGLVFVVLAIIPFGNFNTVLSKLKPKFGGYISYCQQITCKDQKQQGINPADRYHLCSS